MIIRFIALALSLALAAPALAASPVTGRWLTPEKDSIVEIAPCGSKVCGRLSRIMAPKAGRPSTDVHNPDPALRTRPLLGLPILLDFTDKGSSWSGTIYDPRKGKTYRSFLARNPDGSLKVQGCIAFFCQSQIWTRAE